MPPFQHRFRRRDAAIAMVVASFLAGSNAFAVTIGQPATIGTIARASLAEVSGIVDGRANSNVFWVHNDSGDSARFFAINHQGALLGTFPLAGAVSGDWEDLAIAPNSSGGNDLFFADIGDNDANRPFVTVYRTPEPLSTVSTTVPVGGYAAAVLQYPGGARNAESLIIDPLTKEIVIITKAATPAIFTAPTAAFGQALTTMTARGVLGTALSTPTAADISPDGRHILVRSKTAGLLFERGVGQSVADALHGAGMPFTLGIESQGEAIGWAADGASFFTTSESNGQATAPIHQYLFTGPQPGDFNGSGAVDGADLAVWQDHFGIDAWADANGDGMSSGLDFLLWQRNLSAEHPAVAVPESTLSGTLALAALGLVVQCRRRR